MENTDAVRGGGFRLTAWRPSESKRLLGVPPDAVACIFNVDGVLVPSAAIHAEAWRRTFDEFVSRHIERTGVALASFSIGVDYPTLVHGRTRVGSVHAFLASRGLTLPDGSPDDPPGTDTGYGLGNRKNDALLEVLAEHGAHAFEGARLYLELVRDAAMRCAVVSGSTNTRILCERAHFGTLIDEYLDGNTALAERLRRKPAPDMLLAACRHLGVDPARTVVFETTPAASTPAVRAVSRSSSRSVVTAQPRRSARTGRISSSPTSGRSSSVSSPRAGRRRSVAS